MTDRPTPAFGEPLAPTYPSSETLSLLAFRRSTAADLLSEPGPDAKTLASILHIATRVPDHRRVVPFRFIVFQEDGRSRAGRVLADVFEYNDPDAEHDRIEFERRRFERAPVVIAVVSSVDRDHRTPEWEQVLTTGAVCQNMLIAASASGFAAQWLTEWYAFDDAVKTAFELSDNERFAGFIYIGAAREKPKERQRPDPVSLTSYY